MKIETPKKITWPEITVLLGSAASMDKHMLLRKTPHFLYQAVFFIRFGQEKGTIS
jgi:hypothetical protein